MMKGVKGAFCALICIMLALCAAYAEEAVVINGELEPLTGEETLSLLAEVTEEYMNDPEIARQMEASLKAGEIPDPFSEEGQTLEVFTLTDGERKMRFLMEIVGDADENGLYPLYITLHGGGGTTPESNDEEWVRMFDYYREAVESGIYIACRGITDTWDLHFRPESYPLYDRLISTMVRLFSADPDRVYLLGFSAGGDGVYQIAARMTDRFAAANMSSGHPNGVSLRNLANCPFSIQAGVRDFYSEGAMRCFRAAEYEQVLNGYHDELGGGYEHQVLIHVPEGHNYDDTTSGYLGEVLADPAKYADPDIRESMLYAFELALQTCAGDDEYADVSYYYPGMNREFDAEIRRIVREDFRLETTFKNTSAVDYVNRFTRDPAPASVVWDLSTRAESRQVTSFYWLRAGKEVTEGIITAKVTGDNTITVRPENVNGDFSILLHPLMVDFSRPVRIVTPQGEYEVIVHPSRDVLKASMLETGDPALAWAAEIPYSALFASE